MKIVNVNWGGRHPPPCPPTSAAQIKYPRGVYTWERYASVHINLLIILLFSYFPPDSFLSPPFLICAFLLIPTNIVCFILQKSPRRFFRGRPGSCTFSEKVGWYRVSVRVRPKRDKNGANVQMASADTVATRILQPFYARRPCFPLPRGRSCSCMRTSRSTKPSALQQTWWRCRGRWSMPRHPCGWA